MKIVNTLEKKTKDIIGNYFSCFNYPILVNSYGRSGSTVLTKSIIKSAITVKNETARNLALRSLSQSAWDLTKANLKNGIVYKTHDYPPAQISNNDIRMLYTYAEPIDVVLSLLRLYKTRGEVWMREHYEHLKLPFNDFENIIEQDQLGLGQHLEAWLQEKRFPVAFIRYETMWDYQEEISDFLKIPINLPKYRERKAAKNKDGDLMKKLKQTYASLRKKVNSLDSFFTNE